MFILNPTRISIAPYNRQKAVSYAHKWALERNPKYYDFSKIGGDCTNFASQVIYAGCGVMNYTPNTGWYYINIKRRSPAWTDVDFLHRFLVNNRAKGPIAVEIDVKDIRPGDIVQLSFNKTNDFNHSPVVVKTGSTPDISNIEVAAHSIDRNHYPLANYDWAHIRFIHIKGAYH